MALISTPRAPARRVGQLAVTVLRLTAHSVWRSPLVPSLTGCSLISVKPLPGVMARMMAQDIVVATTFQLAIPPPETVGLVAPEDR